MTNKKAKEIINQYKDDTAFYGKNNTDFITGEVFTTYDSMYEMFRNRMGFGKAETMVLIASLKLSGAKFTGELTVEY